jgi:hypothetical protein
MRMVRMGIRKMKVLGPVHDIGGFIHEMKQIEKPWRKKWSGEWSPWFRGEDNFDYDSALQPELYRITGTTRSKLLHHEQELRVECRRRAAQLKGEHQPETSYEWYFTMRQSGAPTRLLDWTDGALVALYFAVNPQNESDKPDRAVYMLDPWWLNEIANLYIKKKGKHPSGVADPGWDVTKRYLAEDEFRNHLIRGDFPLAIDPPHISRRIAAQRSRFTISGREVDGLKRLASKVREAGIFKIRIAGSAASSIKKELYRLGVGESTIFPDLDGLGREMKGYLRYLIEES